MRVLLLNQVFYPDVAATAQHAHDLARHLVAHGHDVAVIASRSRYGHRGASLPRRETVDGIEIHRVGVSLFGKSSIVARLLDFLLFYAVATVKAFTTRRADVVVCFTTPPFIALVGWLVRLLRGSRFVYWVMDLYPDVAVASGVMGARSPLTWVLERLSRFCLRRADRVVVLGRCMRDRILAKGVDGGHVVHIGVWSDHAEVTPVPREGNAYRAEWDLGDRFVVMYSGNIGIVHDMETICRGAARLADDDAVAFVVVGDGKRRADVERNATALGGRLQLRPYQPRERLDELLSCADVHLVSLLEPFCGLVVPSKLFGIMAAARPAIFVGPRASEVARVLEESGAGVVVEEGDESGFAEAVRRLRDDPALAARMGEAGRTALIERYDRAHACAAWQALLESLGPAPPGAARDVPA